MIALELVDTQTGELSYYEVNRLGVQGHRVRMQLTNGSLRTISTKRFILTTVKHKKE
jgi:L-serine deaminase